MAEILSDDAIHARYQEITSQLEIIPPEFLIATREQLDGYGGEHKRQPDGSYRVSLANDIRDPMDVEAILIHELSHHALHLAGYHGPGHAWPMLAVESLLFQKLGWEFNSIRWDASRNWPEQTFWRTWLRNVDHAVALYDEAQSHGNVISLPVRDIGHWVLSRISLHTTHTA